MLLCHLILPDFITMDSWNHICEQELYFPFSYFPSHLELNHLRQMKTKSNMKEKDQRKKCLSPIHSRIFIEPSYVSGCVLVAESSSVSALMLRSHYFSKYKIRASILYN